MTTQSERAFHDWLGENLDRSDDRSKRATWLYCMLLETGELRSIRVRCLTYRCAQGRCAVLDVFEVPGEGLAVGFPRYKTSPQPVIARRTSLAARRTLRMGGGAGGGGPYSPTQSARRPSCVIISGRSGLPAMQWWPTGMRGQLRFGYAGTAHDTRWEPSRSSWPRATLNRPRCATTWTETGLGQTGLALRSSSRTRAGALVARMEHSCRSRSRPVSAVRGSSCPASRSPSQPARPRPPATPSPGSASGSPGTSGPARGGSRLLRSRWASTRSEMLRPS